MGEEVSTVAGAGVAVGYWAIGGGVYLGARERPGWWSRLWRGVFLDWLWVDLPGVALFPDFECRRASRVWVVKNGEAAPDGTMMTPTRHKGVFLAWEVVGGVRDGEGIEQEREGFGRADAGPLSTAARGEWPALPA